MTEVHDLLDEVRKAGVQIRAEGEKLKITPGGLLNEDLKTRLRTRKPEVLAFLRSKSDDLRESMERLESQGINIAIFEDGSMRLVVSDGDTLQAIDAKASIYSPEDAFHYVELSESERRLFHEFKREFGGTVEWRESPNAG